MTATDAPTTLTARAITAAHRHRATDPAALLGRDAFRLRWDRRAITAAHLATALDVAIDTVVVRDDPDRHYGLGTLTTPGDLIEVTGEDRSWYFIPDPTGLDPLWGWLLLGSCPCCEATVVPVARIATLADLGAHLDPAPDDTEASGPPVEFHGDPGHHPHCPHADTTGAAPAGNVEDAEPGSAQGAEK